VVIQKENIHESRVQYQNTLQIVLDDDFNVPDRKADISAIVKERGRVHIDSVKNVSDKAEVTGSLEFALLYTGNDTALPVQMQGSMNFHETINLSETGDNAQLHCSAKVEDITVKAINSRKVSVKAIVTLQVSAEVVQDVEFGCAIADTQEEDELQTRLETVHSTQLAVQLTDNFRIKETTQLPAGKLDVAEVLWDDVDVRSVNTRLLDGQLGMSGQVNIFLMYAAAENSEAVQWYETTIPFDGTLEVSGCNPDMIGFVKTQIMHANVEVRPDYDGENREIATEIVLELSVKAYEEKEHSLLVDMYSPVKNVTINKNDATLRHLLIHNNSQCRISERIKATEYVNLLQICNCTGVVQVDDITMEEDGLQVEGAILANVFYIASDDNAPMGSLRSAVPFSHKVQVHTRTTQFGQNEQTAMEYVVNPVLEDLQAMMTGNNEIEIKGSIGLDTLIFEPVPINTVMDCEVTPFTENEFLKFPGIIGYIANGEETLWDIAKKNHTTTESIRLRNAAQVEKLPDDKCVRRGEKLLLVKAVRM